MRLAIFVGDRLKVIGGMQTNLCKMIEFFTKMSCSLIVFYKYPQIVGYSFENKIEKVYNNTRDVIEDLKGVDVCYFNDGCWIYEWEMIKCADMDRMCIYRTGGNEFVKAPYEDNSFSLEKRQHIWANIINDNIDFVISNSRYTSRRLIEQGINENRILTFRGGVDLKKCRENVINKNDCRQCFDEEYKTKDKIIFSMVARFEPFKGIIDVLKVFSQYKEEKKFFILLVGSGGEEKKIKEYCLQHFDIDQYCILPEMDNDNAMRYISISDFYVNCSKEFEKKSGDSYYIHTETMGRSMFEAIYQYVPVIATDVGGISELFDEYSDIGLLVKNDIESIKSAIGYVLADPKKIVSCGSRYASYGWNYIIEELYSSLFETKKNSLSNEVALCFDIDGTIFHEAFSLECNKKYMEQILSLSDRKEIIINSAANYDEILNRYPIIDKYSESIVIISNCGKHIYVYGKRDDFWEKYTESIPGIQQSIIEMVIDSIVNDGMNVVRVKEVDALYINIKINGPIKYKTICEINKKLTNSQYEVVYNENNVKIISRIVNKSSPIKYILSLNRRIKRLIGAGNNVLDYSFLDICDKAYVINDRSERYQNIEIREKEDMRQFIFNILKDIGEENDEG